MQSPVDVKRRRHLECRRDPRGRQTVLEAQHEQQSVSRLESGEGGAEPRVALAPHEERFTGQRILVDQPVGLDLAAR